MTGKKQIKDVKVGDKVLNRLGKYEPVLNTISRKYSGKVIKINEQICATPEHPFFVVHKKYKDVVNEDNYLKYGQWVNAEMLTSDYLLIAP